LRSCHLILPKSFRTTQIPILANQCWGPLNLYAKSTNVDVLYPHIPYTKYPSYGSYDYYVKSLMAFYLRWYMYYLNNYNFIFFLL